VYSGNDGGIYRSSNGGGAWTALNNNLEITQFYGGGVSNGGSTVHGGTQDNGHLQWNGGTTWTMTFGGDGGYAAVSQSDANTAYEEYVYLDMRKTTNGGASWTSCITGLTDAGSSSLCLFIAPFAMNPENSGVLLAGSDKVWVTSNAAGSWTQSSNTLASGAKVSAVTVLNSAANYLGFAGTTNGRVFKCTALNPASGVDTWTEITPAGNNGAWVRRLVADPTDKQRLFACYSGYNNTGTGKHLYRSSNQGASWTDISTGLADAPVHTLVINALNPSILYAGTEIGVYESTDDGATWTATSSGIPPTVPVDQLAQQGGTNAVFAFTHGRGAFESTGVTPVQLVAFEARQRGEAVALHWRTATETNNYGFEIERREGAGDFARIGFAAGQGTKNTPTVYEWTDAGPWSTSTLEYRLRQIDRDGRVTRSPVAAVQAAPRQLRLALRGALPARERITITVALPEGAPGRCEVYDARGARRAVPGAELLPAGYHALVWDLRDADGGRVPPGVYFVRVATALSARVEKFVVMP
jgi:hypothetical protein